MTQAPMSEDAPLSRPASVCRALLAALEAAEGRRRARKRNQTPDAIGLAAKRALLESVVHDDPAPDQFEAWLVQYASHQSPGDGNSAALAMARAVLEEWRLVHAMPQFATWLAHGAPSADSGDGTDKRAEHGPAAAPMAHSRPPA